MDEVEARRILLLGTAPLLLEVAGAGVVSAARGTRDGLTYFAGTVGASTFCYFRRPGASANFEPAAPLAAPRLN